MTIEVFKTDIQKEADKNYIIPILQNLFPDYKINFDLEDCDKILRVEAVVIDSKKIIECINNLGYICLPLD